MDSLRKGIEMFGCCFRIAVCMLACAAVSPETRAVDFRRVALTGEAPPGFTDGTTYNRLSAGTINPLGSVAFGAILQAAGGQIDSFRDRAIFGSAKPGDLALQIIAREGDRAPDVDDGAVFEYFGRNRTGPIVGSGFLNTPLLADDGGISIYGYLRTTAGTVNPDIGFFGPSDIPGDQGLTLLLRSGQVPDGIDDGSTFYYSPFAGPLHNANGDTIARVALRQPDNTIDPLRFLAILGPQGDSPLSLIIRQGDPVAGLVDGSVYGGFDLPQLDRSGRFLVAAELRNADGTPKTRLDEVIVARPGGSLAPPQVIYRTGDAAPGFSDGRELTGFLDVRLGDSGLSFIGFFQDTDGRKGSAVYSPQDRDSYTVAPVAVSDQSPPGDFDGMVYASFSSPISNAAGDTAFRATLKNPNGEGLGQNRQIFGPTHGAGSPLGLIASTGVSMPGLPEGAVIESFFTAPSPAWVLTDNGSVIFDATIDDPDRGWSDALLAYYGGQLNVVVKVGDPFILNPRAPMSLQEVVEITSFEHGRTVTLDSAVTAGVPTDAISLRLNFRDGRSGVYVVFIPEPTTGAVLLLGLVWARSRP